jgi:hypothetical protein
MTKSLVSDRDVVAAVREPRPFLFLTPARLPLREPVVDPIGQQLLETIVIDAIPQLVRSLVDYTIERQNKRALERGHAQPIQLAVLNRRRRAARTWLLAIAGGKVDGATRHAVATQWMPVLCGTGPDYSGIARPGRVLIEYLRGAITACIFDQPAEVLLREARALAVLEATLAAHLAGLQQIVRLSS